MANNIEDTLALIKNSEFSRKKKEANSSFTKVQENVVGAKLFVLQVIAAILWTWWRIVLPITSYLYKGPVRWVGEKYRKYIWSKFAYKTDKYGNRKLSIKRASAVVASTIIFLSGYNLYWDTALYAFLSERHVSYLNQAQEVKADENIHAVRGCDEKPVCNEQESVYYRATPDVFNQIWSIITHFSLFFPDHIAAAVPPTTHRCEMLSYGFRWKWLIRNMDVYPQILEVKCYPLEPKDYIK